MRKKMDRERCEEGAASVIKVSTTSGRCLKPSTSSVFANRAEITVLFRSETFASCYFLLHRETPYCSQLLKCVSSEKDVNPRWFLLDGWMVCARRIRSRGIFSETGGIGNTCTVICINYQDSYSMHRFDCNVCTYITVE